MLGAAERSGSRASALRALATGLAHVGGLPDSREVLTPLRADPLSLVPVVFMASLLLLQPGRAQVLATGGVTARRVPWCSAMGSGGGGTTVIVCGRRPRRGGQHDNL